MTTIKVYPTKASALNAHHPTAGKPSLEGTDWPNDVFTCRRLTDGSFTTDPSKAYTQAASLTEKFTKPAEPAPAPGPAPAADHRAARP